ncbi:IPT/TIG domain-containing protein [Nocardia sp. NPDC046763]|uniref:IPT/TIG domain-containing protein n=1 Tax=Nocardia sp. NPDC046763 TaxID=3155256 RepID=UPI0033DDE40D
MPTITSLSPNAGPTTGANSVVITGTGFTLTPTTVLFGGTAATFTINSSTSITAIAPAHAAGTVQVTVTNSDGVSNGVSYTYGAPVLTSISPTVGATSGGTTVVLNGTGLATVSAVSFGGTPAASFTVLSDSQISAVTPAHAAGAVSVTVTNAFGTSNSVSFTFAVVPTLSCISPNSGPTAGGQTVIITGRSLTGTTAVSFDGTPAASFTVLSDTTITAVTPLGSPNTVLVTVTTASATSNGVAYTFAAAPTLAAISPTTGTLLGGTTVTLTGTALEGTTDVSFGGTPAASFTVLSDTVITAVTPAHLPGAVSVTVTTPSGTSGSVAFTFL